MEIKDKAGKVLSDPKTNNNMLFVIHIIVLIGTITFLIKNKKSKTKFLILGILLLPFIANAEKMYPLTINITYEVPGETCSKINNNQVKTIIKENIMTNPEFYAKKKATVENLKNSPNMPEQYKKYLIEDEVEGNPLCSRNELVQKIEKKYSLPKYKKKSILTCDKINMSGNDIDLRIFDKTSDGIYIMGVKIQFYDVREMIYDDENHIILNNSEMLHDVIQNDLHFFDYESFNEAVTSDLTNVNKRSRYRNVQLPKIYYEGLDYNRSEATIPITANLTAIDIPLGVEIIDFDLDLDVIMDTSVDTNSNKILINGYYWRPTPITLSMFNNQYNDINSIVEDYQNTIRDLITFTKSDLMIVHNGITYVGMENIYRFDTLTAEETMNLFNEDCWKEDR